jgi:hypothetical protein
MGVAEGIEPTLSAPTPWVVGFGLLSYDAYGCWKKGAFMIGRKIACATSLALAIYVGSVDEGRTQEGLTLAIGKLSFGGSYITQVASVKNDSSTAFKNVKVECGFFRQGQLIATGFSFVENLGPRSTGFTDVLARSDASSERSECRIASTR